MADTDGVTVLVMKDVEGNVYLLDEQAIHACRATTEQQEALTKAFDSQDVAGFVARGLGINVNVNPQINVGTNLNVVAGLGLGNISQAANLGQGNVSNANLFAFKL